MAPRAKTKLKELKCPFCNNDNILAIVDFLNKKDPKATNIGVCLVRQRKTLLGETKSIGCGKTFNLDFFEKPSIFSSFRF